MNIYKIVLTGGPCAGKTKVFEYVKKELEKDNYYVIGGSETARENIINGIVPYKDRAHTLKFQEYMLQYQALKEKIVYDYACDIRDKDFDFIKGKKGIVILYDRALLDNRAYLPLEDFYNLLTKYKYKELEILKKYDLVIDLVSTATSKKDSYVVDEARNETLEDSEKLDQLTTNAYLLHHNLKVIKPTEELEEKKEIVLSYIYDLINNTQHKQIVRTIVDNTLINLNEENSKLIKLTKIYLENDLVLKKINYNNEISYILTKEETIDDIIYYKDIKPMSEKESIDLIRNCKKIKVEEKNMIKVIDNGNQYNIVSKDGKTYIENEITKDIKKNNKYKKRKIEKNWRNYGII